MDRKSKITKKSDIDYSKTIVLSKLQGTQQHFDQEKKRFMETYKAQMESGALTEQKVNEIINNMFIQRNVVEAIKQHIRQSFEEMYDNGELTELVETIKKQNTGIPEDIATKIAQNIIFDTLL
jgi:translation initiation factor 2 beta subunit (eIF-2beta)/eIF-5